MALGGFFGAFANMISGLATSSMQRADNEYLMNKQAELNKEQADYSTDLAKNYWDYTNYENSVKHLKEAGLNPALFYAKVGVGWIIRKINHFRRYDDFYKSDYRLEGLA